MWNQAEKPGGLTLVGETEQTPRLVTRGTPTGATDLTPAPRTRRRYKKRARKCKCGCGETVTPTAQAPHKVYFSDACRNRDYRRRQAKGKPKQVSGEAMLELATCQYCGVTFFYTRGHAAKFCKPAHRVAAAEARRSAAVDALIAELRIPEDEAVDMIDRMGMKLVGRYLRQRHYRYDERARRWSIPLRIVTDKRG